MFSSMKFWLDLESISKVISSSLSNNKLIADTAEAKLGYLSPDTMSETCLKHDNMHTVCSKKSHSKSLSSHTCNAKQLFHTLCNGNFNLRAFSSISQVLFHRVRTSKIGFTNSTFRTSQYYTKTIWLSDFFESVKYLANYHGKAYFFTYNVTRFIFGIIICIGDHKKTLFCISWISWIFNICLPLLFNTFGTFLV